MPENTLGRGAATTNSAGRFHTVRRRSSSTCLRSLRLESARSRAREDAKGGVLNPPEVPPSALRGGHRRDVLAAGDGEALYTCPCGGAGEDFCVAPTRRRTICRRALRHGIGGKSASLLQANVPRRRACRSGGRAGSVLERAAADDAAGGLTRWALGNGLSDGKPARTSCP